MKRKTSIIEVKVTTFVIYMAHILFPKAMLALYLRCFVHSEQKVLTLNMTFILKVLKRKIMKAEIFIVALCRITHFLNTEIL